MGALTQQPFRALRLAREALQAKSGQLLEEYIQTIRKAVSAGRYDEALRGYQWLLDHMPGEKNLRLFDSSVDRLAAGHGGPAGPVVQIGIKVGGTEALPAREDDAAADR